MNNLPLVVILFHMIDYKFTPKTNLADAINELYKIIHLLRSVDGCPFDRVQTKEKSLAALLDEAYEFLDEVNKKDIAGQREEIGDVVWNSFFLMSMSEENNEFTATEVINEICHKMVSRHEHVFGDKKADNPEEVLTLWGKYKETKEGHKTDFNDYFNKIPQSLPPLETSYEIQKKIKKTGLEFADVNSIIDKIQEELDEVKDAIKANESDNTEMEIGDLLFATVNLARFLGYRPNFALNRCNEKIKNRFQTVINLAQERNIELTADNAEAIDTLWEEAKKLHK